MTAPPSPVRMGIDYGDGIEQILITYHRDLDDDHRRMHDLMSMVSETVVDYFGTTDDVTVKVLDEVEIKGIAYPDYVFVRASGRRLAMTTKEI